MNQHYPVGRVGRAAYFVLFLLIFSTLHLSGVVCQAALAADPKIQKTRFIIGLEKKASFQVSSLQNPDRVVIDLPNIGLSLPELPKNGPVGLVKSFHAGLSGPGKTRIVIEVTTPSMVEKANVVPAPNSKLHQLALDIVPISGTKKIRVASRKPFFAKPYNLGASGLLPPTPRPVRHPRRASNGTDRPVIVIDPGHGGHDSGAKKNGIVEKQVVLEFSLLLREKLEKTGRYKILLTRDDDTFVTLDGRRELAEKHKADLFMAVHADYARSSASGATVYTLRDSVAKSLGKTAKRRAKRSAKSQIDRDSVKKANGSLSVLTQILTDLTIRDLDAKSRQRDMVSRSIIQYMGDSTQLRSNPHKKAAFRVLKTAQFPSVLIELAFVTNKKDAERLKSKTWRNKVSDSLVTAVDDYFSQRLARLPM